MAHARFRLSGQRNGKGKLDDPSPKPQSAALGRQGPWTQVGRKSGFGGRVVQSQSSAKVRSLEVAVAALGPGDSSATTEIAEALKRAKEQETAPLGSAPDGRVVTRRDRVAKLEQANDARERRQGAGDGRAYFSFETGPERRTRAPLDVWNKTRRAFIQRARKRIALFDQGHATEVPGVKQKTSSLRRGSVGDVHYNRLRIATGRPDVEQRTKTVGLEQVRRHKERT